MKKLLMALCGGSLAMVLGSGSVIAQDDDDGGAAAIEMYSCKYNEDKGPADLDKVIGSWNKWADKRDLDDYTAWTLTPIYSSSEQDFDVLWLGVTMTGAAMGAANDSWINEGGDVADEFAEVISCDSHSLYAGVEFKAPQDDEPPPRVYLSFSNCSAGDGKSFDTDVAPALSGWADFKTSHGSTAGVWVLFPVYGGGGEDFDFKYVEGHRSLEEQGKDFDAWDGDVANDLFPMGLLRCDSSRVYLAQRQRLGSMD